MPDFPGLTFSPTGNPNGNKTNDPTAGAAPIQDAIRTLSLNVPRVVGASPIPQGLLGGPGSAGLGGGGGMSLEEIIRRLFGGGTGAPTPNVIPGFNPGEPSQGRYHPGGYQDPTPPPVAPPMPAPPPGGTAFGAPASPIPQKPSGGYRPVLD